MNKYSAAFLIGLFTFLVTSSILLTGSAQGDGKPFYASVPTAYMDDPRRIEWQMAGNVVERLQIQPGSSVADIGAGTGYFTMIFAEKVGADGTVYAVDVDEKMISHVEKRVRKSGFRNVRSILSRSDDPLLPKESIDLVFVCDTYLFLEDRVQYLLRLRESLKNKGHLAIVSFNSRAELPGAPPLYRMISKETTIHEAEKAGFSLLADYRFLPYQDFLVFKKR